ncbi:MAG: hypothetical protein DI537_17550 [Stutzerimonas stutzeri]|nr:MAG: hypothetical protein DI537_17550 [Stutzerimonas stutzeri]
MGRVAKGLIVCFLAALIGLVGLWYWHLRPVTITEATKAQIASLSLASWVLEQGGRPEDWSTRAYLPTSAVQQLASGLVGLEYVSRVGKPDTGGEYPAAFVATLNDFSIETEGTELRPSLRVSVRYEDQAGSPWWARAAITLKVRAVLVPVVVPMGDGKKPEVRLRVLPLEAEPGFSFNPIAVISTGKLFSEIIAAGVLVGLGNELYLGAPALTEKLEVALKSNSTSHTDFEKGGGYDLNAKLDGPTFSRPIEAKLPLVTARGLWLLDASDKVLPAPAVVTGDDALLALKAAELRASVSNRIRPFQREDDVVEVRISNRPIISIADEIASATSGYKMIISSQNATGNIAEAFLLKDNLLGDIGILVRPRVPDFIGGEANFAPPSIKWVPGEGLQTAINVSAQARASFNVHLSTGKVGGGIGKDIDIAGATSGTVPVSLKVEKSTVSGASALVLQPVIGCTRIAIDLNPSTREDFIKEAWIALKPFGVRIKRNVGGGRQAPSVLLTELPTLESFGEKSTDPNALKGKQSFIKPKFVRMAWAIKDVQVQPDGLFARAALAVTPGPSSEEYESAVKEQSVLRDNLMAALKEASPAVECAPTDEFSLLLAGNGVEVGGSNDVVRFIIAMSKAQAHVATETIKEIEKLYNKPFDTLAAAPDNVWREAGTAVENVGREIDKAAESVRKGAESVGEAIGDFFRCPLC